MNCQEVLPERADPIDTNYIRYATWDAEAFAVTLPTADFTYTSDLSLFNFTDGSSDNFPCYYWDSVMEKRVIS